MYLNKGYYRALGADSCMVEVVKIKYRGETYCMAMIRLIGIRNGVLYETIRNAKLYYHRITHWKKITRGA